MSSDVCAECLTSPAVVDDGGRCSACRCRALLEDAYGTGWRRGWAACENFYEIDRATGEVAR